MNKRLYLAMALVVAAALLGACGGGGGAGKPPVPMQKYETGTFVLEYPAAWQKNSLDIMGVTMAFFSSGPVESTDLLGFDFTSVARDNPIFFLMVVPSSMVGEMGLDDLDAAMADIDIANEPDVKIIKQGDTTVSGAKGKLLIATGTDPDIGKMGAHIVMAKRDDGTALVLMGATPEKDLNANLKIFEYMQAAFKFK